MQCPDCQSKNTKKLSMVYATGTRRSSSRSRSSRASSRFTVSVGGSQRQGVSQTALAQMASPPQPSTFPKLIAGFLVLFFIFPGLAISTSDGGTTWGKIFSFIILIALSVATFFIYKYLNRNYEQQLNEWNRAWICMRCGCLYDPYDDDDDE